MHLIDVIKEILGSKSGGFTFEVTKDGGLYMVNPNKKAYWFTKDGRLIRTKDITSASDRKPYAPGYTQPPQQ